ncbi:MAG TPA: hypothetical protein VGR71_02880 [Nitrospira sp.]|nr:hypothetical protein [Nitrospira sp.]
MKVAIRLSLLVLIAFAQFSAAQMGMGMGRAPSMAGVFSPEVGSGGAYEVLRKDENQKTNFEVAVIGKEGPGYWIEYTMQSPHGTVYAKSLNAREGDNVMVQKMIVQMPGRPPMDMGSMMKAHAMQSEESKADMRANAENLGTETITTPAGTFSCQHWRSKKDGSEYWLSDKVSPWKLVKMTNKDQTMTLTKVITDAKTHITGTPVSMEDMMKGMGNMGQRPQ